VASNPRPLPLRSTLRPALRSPAILRSEAAENTTLPSVVLVGLLSLWLLWRLLGARPVPVIASQALPICLIHPTSLAQLTRGVDLLIGYVDLRYGCPFEELADLSQLTDRREMASVRPI
jgi:hypothetical protein